MSDKIKHPKNKIVLRKLLKPKSFNNSRFSKASLIIFGLIFAILGGYIIYKSFAANNGPLNGPSSLPARTEVAFDAEHFPCKGQVLQKDKTFSLSYAGCFDDISREIQYLAQHNIRLIRIWPMVSQFFVHEPRSSTDITYDD